MGENISPSQAYAQLLPRDDNSKAFTVINTNKGLFKYNRLCFGICLASGIFQQALEQLFDNFSTVFCYLDDIII